MNCPVCKQELKTVAVKNISINYCDKCHGIWCDKDELDRLARIDRQLLNQSPIAASLQKESSPTAHSHLNCPICEAQMDKYNYSYDSDIFLDSCRICSGVWLDNGELSDILDYLYSPAATALETDPEE